MITLSVLFYVLMVFFVLIGALRGWSKEVLVFFAGIVSLAVVEVLLPKLTNGMPADRVLMFQLLALLACAFIGYQTPSLRRLLDTGRFERNSTRDLIMGAFMGAFNGYLFVGSAWYFIAKANYPFTQIIPPDAATEAGQEANKILSLALPNYLQVPNIYYAIILGCLIVLGVFI